MATFTELAAALIVQSSAAAFGHFGVVVEPVQAQRPPANERVIARTPRRAAKVSDCPQAPPARVLKA